MKDEIIRDSVLRIGEVTGVEGRKVYILVDTNKNTSDLLLNGDIIKNISVGAYIEIRKGFMSLIGKVEGEKLTENRFIENNNCNKRILSISLAGYIDHSRHFIGGIKELPLIGNEAFILTKNMIQKIHTLGKEKVSNTIKIAETDIESIPISIPIDGLFNSHIALFGNTGSGKSNTLAALYQALFKKIEKTDKCKFLFFDFNGEYTKVNCLSESKKVYKLSTKDKGDKIPIKMEELFSLETLSILVEATEKTQKPFLKRVLRFYKNAKAKNYFFSYTKGIIKNKIIDVLKMTDKDVAFKVLDYLDIVIKKFCNCDEDFRSKDGIGFHNKSGCFMIKDKYINRDSDDEIKKLEYYKIVEDYNDNNNKLTPFDELYIYLHLQLISDLYSYKVQNDHIYPVINRIKSKQKDIESIFEIFESIFEIFEIADIWCEKNIIVISMKDVNIDMRKTIPLLIAKEMYAEHKEKNSGTTFNIIIDEAHNILSKSSFRETADWKDYRLETFEEIIKEGRKFGVFLTISSQRPNDISETIISQAHNYFIHQLINQRDLQTIGNAVSYIDKITEESIPTLPVETCIFSGIATSMPLKIKVYELKDENKPESETISFEKLISK